MKRKYRKYTDEDVIKYAKEVFSIAGVLERLNLKKSGGNYAHIKKTLQRLNIDCSHWTGQGWNKDQQLKDWSDYSRVGHLKKHLIRDRTNCCENCLNSKWLDSNIPLEVHHIDGDRTNNSLDNLKLLCPNCHAFTDNYRNKKKVVGAGEIESPRSF